MVRRNGLSREQAAMRVHWFADKCAAGRDYESCPIGTRRNSPVGQGAG